MFTTAAVIGMTRAMQPPVPPESRLTSAVGAGRDPSGPEIDRFLAASLRQEDVAWPTQWGLDGAKTAVVRRIAYHGISGLLNNRAQALLEWPGEVLAQIRDRSLGHAMWETRHRIILARLVGAFAQAEVRCLFLKGTGLAYDLYQNPATRVRGDSDLLVDRGQLEQARDLLTDLGFFVDPNVSGLSDDIHLQEIWQFAHPDGSRHDIDLHWQVMNSFALSNVIEVEVCFANAIALPRLASNALTLDHVSMLVHTAMHKATHIVSPYFSDGQPYYGGDRLIWCHDIHLLARAFSQGDWAHLVTVATKSGVAEVCLSALAFARDRLDTPIPVEVLTALHSASPADRQSHFLLRYGQLNRAWRDVRALAGWHRKSAYVLSRLMPPQAFMRAKYPELASHALVVLYLRRAADLLRARPGRERP